MTPAPERKYAEALSAIAIDGTFCGYASLFGRMDLSGDVVEPGAFTRTLARRGVDGVGMLLEHDPRQPIGAWTLIEEDATGLWVEGRLARTPAAGKVGALMHAGDLDGLSIGFSTVAARPGRTPGVRLLTEIDLWEISVVRAPMLPEARARAAGTLRAEAGGEGSLTAVDAGLIARMRRTTAILRQTR